MTKTTEHIRDTFNRILNKYQIPGVFEDYPKNIIKIINELSNSDLVELINAINQTSLLPSFKSLVVELFETLYEYVALKMSRLTIADIENDSPIHEWFYVGTDYFESLTPYNNALKSKLVKMGRYEDLVSDLKILKNFYQNFQRSSYKSFTETGTNYACIKSNELFIELENFIHYAIAKPNRFFNYNTSGNVAGA